MADVETEPEVAVRFDHLFGGAPLLAGVAGERGFLSDEPTDVATKASGLAARGTSILEMVR